MLRELIIFNPLESGNLGIRLPELAKIGIGDPSTRWKGNLIKCI